MRAWSRRRAGALRAGRGGAIGAGCAALVGGAGTAGRLQVTGPVGGTKYSRARHVSARPRTPHPLTCRADGGGPQAARLLLLPTDRRQRLPAGPAEERGAECQRLWGLQGAGAAGSRGWQPVPDAAGCLARCGPLGEGCDLHGWPLVLRGCRADRRPGVSSHRNGRAAQSRAPRGGGGRNECLTGMEGWALGNWGNERFAWRQSALHVRRILGGISEIPSLWRKAARLADAQGTASNAITQYKAAVPPACGPTGMHSSWPCIVLKVNTPIMGRLNLDFVKFTNAQPPDTTILEGNEGNADAGLPRQSPCTTSAPAVYHTACCAPRLPQLVCRRLPHLKQERAEQRQRRSHYKPSSGRN